MRKKILSAVMVLTMLLSLLPVGALAVDTEELKEAVLIDSHGEKTYGSLKDLLAKAYGTNVTVQLLKDITYEAETIDYGGIYASYGIGGEDGVRCNLDLGGHTVTVAANLDSNYVLFSALYVVQNNCEIRNGTIVADITSTGKMEEPYFDGYRIAEIYGTSTSFKNIALISDSTDIDYGILFSEGWASSTDSRTLSLYNVTVVSEGTAIMCIPGTPSGGTPKDLEIAINSGSFKNLNLNSSEGYKVTYGTRLPVSDVSNDTSVITSPATTGMTIRDGNAYLYDTLQEAVNAVEPDGTIQLLRQPGDQSVTVPTNAYFRIVSFDGASADVGAITFATGEGYQVIVDEDGWVHVEKADVPVTDISLNRTWLTLTKGDTAGLTATVSPSNATDKDVTWISSDTAIATVAEGIVTAVAPGTATITATAGGESATCTVTVTAAQQPSTPSTSDRDDDDDGYSISVPASSSIRGGSITVSPRRADRDDTVTITVTPDDGYALDELSVTTRGGDAVSLRQRNDSQYTFEMPAGSVVIHVSFMEQSSTPAEEMFFSDVPSDFWACNEIQWAFENGYMNGTTSTTFAPGGAVTRQQVWMILARMAGSDPADMAAARAWAVNNGISDGTNPGAAVTRQQLVALLYRFAAQNGYDTTARADLSGYPDVASVASYAADAMAWSVAEGIVGGTTQGTLNPAGTANRAQFAVILWRFYQTSAN